MDLFVINRFTGDDEFKQETGEEIKLNKILENIKKRKKKKIELKLDKSEEALHTEDSTIQNTVQSEINSIEVEENESTEQKNVSETEDIDNLNDIEIDEPESKKIKADDIDIEGFTILGTKKFDGKQKVKRVLPKWLRNPDIFSVDLHSSTTKLSSININKSVKSKLKEKNIKHFFPVQSAFIPWQLNTMKHLDKLHPRDVCISAPTGSGKTLAFTIPILEYLVNKLERRCLTVKAIRALIILPTQSLALQIHNNFEYYCSNTNIRVGIISSTESFKAEQSNLYMTNSVWGLLGKIDVLICTPGRLIDHIKLSKGFNLQYLEFIIVDEADRALDSLQNDWLYHLDNHLRNCGNSMRENVLNLISLKNRSDPQKLLFSATLSHDPEKLQQIGLFQPKLFTCTTDKNITELDEDVSDRFIGKYITPKELTEKYIVYDPKMKPLVLYKLIMDTVKTTTSPKIIVFTNDTDTVCRLSMLLCYMAKGDFRVAQMMRQKNANIKITKSIMASFESGTINVLICTDFMARGIDVTNVNCVISYSIPAHSKTYIHRVGRTARAGMEGLCITMLEEREVHRFLKMFDKHVEPIEYDVEELNNYVSLYKTALSKLKYKISSTTLSKLREKRRKGAIIVKKKKIFIKKK